MKKCISNYIKDTNILFFFMTLIFLMTFTNYASASESCEQSIKNSSQNCQFAICGSEAGLPPCQCMCE